MNAPAGLVLAALGLWGWSIGQLVLGLLLGAVYEITCIAGPSAAVSARLALVLRACGLAALGLLGYVIATQSLPHSLYTWLRWLPLVSFAVPALARLSGGLTTGHLLQALGRARGREDNDRTIDPTHGYAAIALAAAGTGTGAAGRLYAGYAAIAGWALLAHAPRHRLAGAAVMFVGAAAIGHAVHTGIWILQGRVEDWGTELFQEYFAGKPDPFRERTRIGDLGRIKLSDRILMRVEAEGARPASILLRESAFERYRNGEWQNARPRGRMVARDGDRWVLSGEPAARRLTVRRSLASADGLLALPLGTRAVENLPALEVELFPSGAALVRGGPRFAAFSAAYDPAGESAPPDGRADLEVPANLAEVLDRTIAANGLRRGSPAESVEAVRAYFDAGYSYSLDLGDRTRTLADFLATDRKGHCEYFASATVMLLRSLGIPARYAAGYSVQEWSALERAFIVRNRHAHAWAQAYVDGRWVEVDTTPSRWADMEAEAARGFFAPMLDTLSWLMDRIVQAFVASDGRSALLAFSLGLGSALLGIGAVIALRRWRRRGGAARARPDAIARAWRGVEARVGRMGHRRGQSETVRGWMHRLGSSAAGAPWLESLEALARDYYRVRFDPATPAAEAARFIEAARRWR